MYGYSDRVLRALQGRRAPHGRRGLRPTRPGWATGCGWEGFHGSVHDCVHDDGWEDDTSWHDDSDDAFL